MALYRYDALGASITPATSQTCLREYAAAVTEDEHLRRVLSVRVIFSGVVLVINTIREENKYSGNHMGHFASLD